MNNLTIFLSYSIKDKVIAGKYKRHFETYYGFQVFVSHDDLIPSEEWNPNIIDVINNSDIFLLLVSKNSVQSAFVNQEIGMAIAGSLKIFPIRLDKEIPPGFIDKIQGFPPTEDQNYGILTNGSRLFSILTTHPNCKKYADKAILSAIIALKNSACFRNTVGIISTLLEVEKAIGFSDQHLSRLIEAINTNRQVNQERFEYPLLKKLLADKYQINDLIE